jgi:hypothetical protein
LGKKQASKQQQKQKSSYTKKTRLGQKDIGESEVSLGWYSKRRRLRVRSSGRAPA